MERSPDEWLTEDDLASMCGCADEPTFDVFVQKVGGYRIDALHDDLDFPNADYVFPADKVIIELKILETEVHNTAQFAEKMNIVHRRLHAKHGKTPLPLDPIVEADYLKAFIDLFRAPLARIAKKTNTQVKSTKQHLNYSDHKGVLLLVNDRLKELPPRFMLGTLGRILNGSCSSIRAVIYLTNHYVLTLGDDYGRILWVPLYADSDDDQLIDFVNRLGSAWFDHCEAIGEPSDDRRAGPDYPLEGSRAAGARFPVS